MSEIMEKKLTELEKLTSKLLSSLDETVFFPELGKYFHKLMSVDQTLIYLVKEDGGARLISKNGKLVKKEKNIDKGIGATGHVVRTRSPYFSNNIDRDPVFAENKEKDVVRELVLPISHEGIVIATLHFQCKDCDKEFSPADMVLATEALTELKAPLANMRMYLSAKHLNESLLRQIEVKEQEIVKKAEKSAPGGTFKIEEKEIIVKSDAMKNIVVIADKLSQSDASALVVGERGVGKELVARRIHCRSKRASESFISIDCSIFDELSLEKEIFGEESGGFNNVNIKNGLLELSNGGTLFINNIDKMSLHLQSKLNSFINEKLGFRVGGHMPFRSDTRIIAASTKRLEEEVREGNFREDFFFNINTMSLCVPSLRERHDDIELLANYFLNLHKSNDEQKSFSPGVISALRDYNWPGNIRELQNVIERSYILSEGMIIEKDHLADSITNTEEEVIEESKAIEFSEMTLNELEKRHICLTLEHLGGNKTKTAKTLGITVKTLYNKLHSYGMIGQQEER